VISLEIVNTNEKDIKEAYENNLVAKVKKMKVTDKVQSNQIY